VNVLVVNAGSSSLKFRLLTVDGDTTLLARGLIERVGGEATLALASDGVRARQQPVAARDHVQAVERALAALRELRAGLRIDAVGHRIVHGGARFVEPTLLDDDVLAELAALERLAPLHNGPGIAAARACREHLEAGIPMVAVFDTAFHAGLPAAAATYALPRELAERHGIRRYGFHGISYQYVTGRYAALAGVGADAATLIAFHLGNGCSAAAIARGRSVETSMGFTPLEGLVMGTRSGDVDPAVVAFLAGAENVSAAVVEGWLNERSGLLGLAGGSRDVRDLFARADRDERARLALDVFCHRARKYLGAYMAVLGGAPAVVFTGGIGEHQPEIRRRICDGMAWCGLVLDEARNRAAVGVEATVSAPDSAVRVLVLPTDEERVIAAEVARRLRAGGHSGAPGNDA
jgi:acetate kinase